MSYHHLLNQKNLMNGLDLLALVPNNEVKVVFFDPQYRGILDKMDYGNEGKDRSKARCELPQMDYETITKFMVDIERVLRPNGYLFLWLDKFHLLDTGIDSWSKWLENSTELHCVDMIIWDKKHIAMGYRTRRRSEYCAIIQKAPRKAKSTWKLHNIPDVWVEDVKKTHTHSKPVELQKTLILATTDENDLVIDPTSGGYSVFVACRAINRNFLGCDLKTEPNLDLRLC